jgi:hypothetical protein
MNHPAGPGKLELRVCKALMFFGTITVTESVRYRSMAPSRSWLTGIFAPLGSYDSHDNLTRDNYGNVVCPEGLYWFRIARLPLLVGCISD